MAALFTISSLLVFVLVLGLRVGIMAVAIFPVRASALLGECESEANNYGQGPNGRI